MTNDSFGLVPQPAQKTGSRWFTTVTAVDESGAWLGDLPIRPCKTKRELLARADILVAKLSAAPGYNPAAAF
jgi:hypothetical protein